MKNITRWTVFVMVMALAALPSVSLGATFAYVNREGEVRTVTADTATIALTTAPNIHQNSGVLMMDSADDNIVLKN